MSYTSKAHGAHNFSLSTTLVKGKHYTDWAVTTAFYSSMHFLYHKLFPLADSGKTFNSFADYYAFKYPGGRKGKHLVTKHLSRRLGDECFNKYNWLHDQSMTARYTNYQVPLVNAKKALKRAGKIKSICGC